MSIEQTDDLDATARILKRGADRGDADAQYMLAICYRDGDGAAQSPLQAARWFVAAADQGHAEAAYEAAMCLRSGVSGALPSGMQESAVYYQRDGVVTSKLETSAFDYFRFAAQQDHLESQFELGMCYVRGAGVAADSDAAREWLQRASAQGHARAMLSLLFGGFVCDALEKFRYCEIAALEGIADGQYELAVCYRDGIGTDIDIFTAKLWFGRASSQVLITY